MIQGAQGLSFSVGINTAKEIAQQLIHHGKVFKAYIGVMLQEIVLNPKLKHHLNLSNKKGLFVARIEPDSPASRSQLQEGDIIISFNGHTVNSTHELFKELSKKEILTIVDISVIRRSEMLNFSIAPLEAKQSA
jgi:S1-C subfamily serine protease